MHAKHVIPLYRSILHQARLLSHTWADRAILRSHTYLARHNLEPVLRHHLPNTASNSVAGAQTAARQHRRNDLAPAWPPSTDEKRIRRARTHLRHLADANQGWPHAAKRAIELAYARRGKLRRDALSLLAPQPSSSPDEARFPRRLRQRDVHPLLAHLLVGPDTMRGSASRPQHLERPPPEYLPACDDPVLTKFGRRIGRRRASNAWRKWASTQMKKIVLPIDIELPGRQAERFGQLEAMASVVGAPLPRRARRRDAAVGGARGSGSSSGSEKGAVTDRGTVADRCAPPRYLERARREVPRFASRIRPQTHRQQWLRTHGWLRSPKDFATLPRARRRVYAGLLEKAPVLRLAPPEPTGGGGGGNSQMEHASGTVRDSWSRNDPLGIRSQLREAMDLPDARMSTNLSEHATKRKGPKGAPPGSERELTADDLEYLRAQGIL